MNILVKNLTVHLTAGGKPVLSGVDLTFVPGSITLLIGKTGAGKSTLLRTLSGLIRPTMGEVQVGDEPLFLGKRVNRRAIEPTMMLFQSAEQQFFRPTLRGEFEYSLRRLHLQTSEVEERMEHALEAVQLPLHLAPVNARELSGGQQRRAAMATTVAPHPTWYLLDEPSSGLDGDSVRALQDFVVTAAQRDHRGFLISTHDLDAWFPIAHRVVVLDAGHIRFDGTPEELCERSEILLESGVGLPSFTKLSLELTERGWDMPHNLFHADDVADAIMERFSGDFVPEMVAPEMVAPEMANCDTVADPGTVTVEHHSQGSCPKDDCPNGSGREVTVQIRNRYLVQAIDARAKWLCYIALSISWLTVPALALIPATAALALVYGSLSLTPKSAWRIVRVFSLLMISAVLFAGVHVTSGITSGVTTSGAVNPSLLSGLFAHVMWSWQAALTTLLSLYRILLILLLSAVFTETTSTIAMRTSLEGVLQPLSRFGFPSEAFAFATALVLRFVPLLTVEAGRFSEIAQVRGKKVRKPGRIALSDAGTFMLPLVFSLFHLGEELSFAMEARGLSHFGKLTRKRRLPRFTKKEWSLLGGTTLFILLLFFVM